MRSVGCCAFTDIDTQSYTGAELEGGIKISMRTEQRNIMSVEAAMYIIRGHEKVSMSRMYNTNDRFANDHSKDCLISCSPIYLRINK